MEKRYRPCGKKYLHVNDQEILKINQEYVTCLKSLAQKDDSGKCMMCLHNDTRDYVHEKIFVCPPNDYVRPHSHPKKIETKMVIEGELMVVIFDKSGGVEDKFIMGRDGIFTSRLGKGIIHMDIPLTDVVFHEVTTGPFTGKDDSVFPEWAPALDDETGIRKLLESIVLGRGNGACRY